MEPIPEEDLGGNGAAFSSEPDPLFPLNLDYDLRLEIDLTGKNFFTNKNKTVEHDSANALFTFNETSYHYGSKFGAGSNLMFVSKYYRITLGQLSTSADATLLNFPKDGVDSQATISSEVWVIFPVITPFGEPELQIGYIAGNFSKGLSGLFSGLNVVDITIQENLSSDAATFKFKSDDFNPEGFFILWEYAANWTFQFQRFRTLPVKLAGFINDEDKIASLEFTSTSFKLGYVVHFNLYPDFEVRLF
ncbi:MAG: hypothetical protein HQM13_20220 [SAR324 cluster bacterium]|nr:hypothetical protein [SAR324 cluster bacterium]